MGRSSLSVLQMVYITGGAAILLLALTGQNGCLFPGVSAYGYIGTYPPHIWLGVPQKAYDDSLFACNAWKGNLTGQACYHDSHCKGGSVCMSRYLRNRQPTISLCCCRFQQQGECCDQKATCPGCERPFCPEGFDPCDHEVCYRHLNATCVKDDVCRECRARFFYNGTEVTNICHILIFPSREPPTSSGYMPEEDGVDETPSSMVEEEPTMMIVPASMLPTPTMPLATGSPSPEPSP